MKRQFALVLIAVILLSALTVMPVMSQVADENVADVIPDADKTAGICKMLYFSTEEEFITQGPEPPDGNPIISDGDLLGPGCVVFARNHKLLLKFDTERDLGLDAADVLDMERFLVAFSTELDDPNGQFTAGDLLVTNGAVIPNQALLANFTIQSADLGLDAVHFIGDIDQIIKFLDQAAQVSRDEWLKNLPEMLERYDIDIWFSTEGTAPTPETPRFLDGDLLSARTGTIVVANIDLLPITVPAGIQVRGVDFGLDAVIADREGNNESIRFSTEILYEERPSFTDGDVLLFGNGVVCTNYDLVQCFEPKTKELGLDALALVFIPPGCRNQITHIAGVSVDDIGSDGMAVAGSAGSPPIPAPVPFGGFIDIQGTICEDVDKFRVAFRKAETTNDWTGIRVMPGAGWKVNVDDVLEGPCGKKENWSSDSDGWYDANRYRQLTDPTLGYGGCNPGLSLTVWDSAHIEMGLGGPDALYEVRLETQTGVTNHTGQVHLVQLDNIWPTVGLSRTPDTPCENYTEMPITPMGRINDTHFWRYQLRLTGDGYGIHSYVPIAYYDDPLDNIIENGTSGWPAYVGLHQVSVYDLDHTPVNCGYTVLLTAWDRTLHCAFSFANNHAYHSAGWRHNTDAWTFKYQPSP
jgi:hypothetical protein